MRKQILILTVCSTMLTWSLTRVSGQVHFNDENLKEAVKEALGVTSDPDPRRMARLSELNAREKGIADLTGLEYALNLHRLDLANNQIGDLSPLADLTALQDLNLYRNRITDISALSSLVNLQVLNLSENAVSDLAPLSGLTSVVNLGVTGNQIKDLAPLAGLTGLEGLQLYENQISDISSLAGLTELRSLSLFGNMVTDLTPLATAANLERLYVDDNLISDISPLAALTNLKSLGIAQNTISDVSALAGLTQLETLQAFYNEISDISALAGLTRLEYLWLAGNEIGDISALAGLTRLKHLWLTGNEISDLTALSRLLTLQYLSLDVNRVSDLTPLSGLTNLAWLFLSENRIEELSPLSGLGSLDTLHLRSNQICDISDLCVLVSLKSLDVQYNPLQPEAYELHIPRIESNGTTVWYNEVEWCTLTLGSTAGGSIVSPGMGTLLFPHEWEVAVEALPADANFAFARWSGSAVEAGLLTDPSAPASTVRMEDDLTLRAHFVSLQPALYVGVADPNAPPGVGTRERPWIAVQDAIDVASEGATVLIGTGVYEGNLDLGERSITLQGLWLRDPERHSMPVLTSCTELPVVRIAGGQDADCVVGGLAIEGGRGIGVYCEGASPTLSHCLVAGNLGGGLVCRESQPVVVSSTIAGNGAEPTTGGIVLLNSNVTVINSILWGNRPSSISVEAGSTGTFQYCNVEGGSPGVGNINVNPAFVLVGYWGDSGTPHDPNDDFWVSGDYHLKSQTGRWDPGRTSWIVDDASSPCIDAGDPSSPVGEEMQPHGGRINMGAYGGTTEASLTL